MNKWISRYVQVVLLVGYIGAAPMVLTGQTSTYTPNQSVAKYRVDEAVPFAMGMHGALLADLYIPIGRSRRCGIVFIHGGGWQHGDRSQLRRIALDLAADGYVGMAIDYDLTATGEQFPLALQESKEAIRWLRSMASTYSIDPSRIVTVGSSAGGELAALVGLTSGNVRYESGQNLTVSSAVRAVAVFNGVLDLSSYTGTESEDIVKYIGGDCSSLMIRCEEASPLHQIKPGAPAFFVGHGTADQTVPYQQAVAFIDRLRAAKVPVTTFVATDGLHTYWASDRWYLENVNAVKKFLQSTLDPPR